VVEQLFQALTVADLLAPGTTTSSPVRYIRETDAVVNAAAAVAEGAAKPEATLVTEPVRKIAVFLPVTDEIMEDAPTMASYLNERLSLFVGVAEEAQLLSGDGTAPNISGILDRSGIQTQPAGTDDNLVAIRKAVTVSRRSYLTTIATAQRVGSEMPT
jgi:HK97 family phage major capsid protein